MPSALVLVAGGECVSVTVPSTASDLAQWRHDIYFPLGVVLHRAAPLADGAQGSRSQSLLLYCSTAASRVCNVHELPRVLDTPLLFGHLLIVLVIGQHAVSSLTHAQYQFFLSAGTQCTPLSSLLSNSLGVSPTEEPKTAKKRTRPKKLDPKSKKRHTESLDESSGDEVMAMITSDRSYKHDDGSFDADPVDISYGDD